MSEKNEPTEKKVEHFRDIRQLAELKINTR